MTEGVLTSEKLIMRVLSALAVLALVMLSCAMVGSERISFARVFDGPGAEGHNADYEIFVGVRIPRVLLAAIVGAALAASGVVLQAILRNPLAEPFILGISSGAGLGVIIAILSGLGWELFGGSGIAIFAFAGSLGTVWLVWGIGRMGARSNVTSLLLAGVVVNAFFSALIMFLISIAKSDQLQSTIFWLMGNITERRISVLAASGVCILAGIVVLFGISRNLNVLSFGEAEAKSMGVNTAKVKFIAFTFASFITAVAVSLSGLVGFVGLIVPHGVRLFLGPDHRQLLPISVICGAIFLVAADTLARTIVAPAQLPVGVVTAIAGGPFFLFLLWRYTKKVSWLK